MKRRSLALVVITLSLAVSHRARAEETPERQPAQRPAPAASTAAPARRVDPFVHGYAPDTPASSGWVIGGRSPGWTAPPGREDAPAAGRGERKDRPEDRPFRAGFVVGLGAPNLMNIGLTTKVTRYLGFGASFGLIPEMQVPYYGEATVSYQSYSVNARVHPLGGGFFLGSGLGYAVIKGTYQQSVDVGALSGVAELGTQTLKGDGSIRSWVVTPSLGYQAIFDSGLVLSLDVGAQIPVSDSQVEFATNVPSVVRTVAPEQYTQSETKVRDTLQRIGQQVLPTLNLQLGWMF